MLCYLFQGAVVDKDMWEVDEDATDWVLPLWAVDDNEHDYVSDWEIDEDAPDWGLHVPV